MEGKLNVVIFGETGSGKSSAVNLLLGKEVAVVSDKAVGCTFEFQKFEAPSYNLYDTVGLSEGGKGTVKQSFAVNQLINLLKSLEDGVSLLIFVMEKGRIKKSLDENYKLFAEAICMKNVPVVLLITHCEMDREPGLWWRENKQHFDRYGMNFKAVICGCTMNPTKAPPLIQPLITSINKSTLAEISAAIVAHMLIPGWKVKGGWRSWFQSIVVKVLKFLANFFGFTSSSGWLSDQDEPNFQERLYSYFIQQGYEPIVSRQMSNDIANAF